MAENYFMGQDGFVWFIGCVESRNDPAELGRVQVRCLGYHTENKEDIPTADLPWAHVMHPTTDPSMQGMGTTPSFLVEGTWVVGFFRDAVEKQQPIIMGSLPGYNQETANSDKGFNDPNGVYPAAFHSPSGHSTEESDINRLARNSPTRQHEVIGKKDKSFNGDPDSPDYNPTGRTLGVNDSNGGTRNEPPSPYNALYPKNHVFESESGHIKEYDDTPGFERIHEYHASGTFHEVDSNGTKRTRIVGNNYEVIAGDEYVNVKGTVNLTIDADCNTSIAGDWNIIVGKNKNEVIVGDYTQEVHENVVIKYAKDMNQNVAGNIEQKYGTDTTNTIDTEITGTTTETVGLIKNVNVVGDSNEDSDTFEQAVNETYNQKLITKVTKAVEETFTGGQKTLITGTLDLDATTEVDIRSAAVNLNKGDVEEGGTVEEVEKPNPALVATTNPIATKLDVEPWAPVNTEVDNTVESMYINTPERASEPLEDGESSGTPDDYSDNVLENKSGERYIGEWNNFDSDTSDPQIAEQQRDWKKYTKVVKGNTVQRYTNDWPGSDGDFWNLRKRQIHRLNWHCTKSQADSLIPEHSEQTSANLRKAKTPDKFGKNGGCLGNIYPDRSDFDGAFVEKEYSSPLLVWTNADGRIRSELGDIMVEIANAWCNNADGRYPDGPRSGFGTKNNQKFLSLTSGYRDPVNNASVGGGLIHRTGRAVDVGTFPTAGGDPWPLKWKIDFIQLAIDKGIRNIGTYTWGFHFDITGSEKTKRQWYVTSKTRQLPEFLPVFLKNGYDIGGAKGLGTEAEPNKYLTAFKGNEKDINVYASLQSQYESPTA